MRLCVRMCVSVSVFLCVSEGQVRMYGEIEGQIPGSGNSGNDFHTLDKGLKKKKCIVH